MRCVLWSSLLATACAAGAQAPNASAPTSSAPATGGVQTGPSMEYDPQIITTLLQLLDAKDKTRPSESDFSNTSLKDILTLGTPSGFHLRNRYTRLGVSLADALSAADDLRLKNQLIELARWERSEDIRAIALISLAQRKEPEHLKFFHEALLNPQVEIRFAALEALGAWGRPEAKEEYRFVLRSDRAAIVQIYAAQALARLGEPEGLDVLRQLLDSSDWVARAMSAKYLGDLGTGEDYNRMLDRMTKDQNTNDFVTAECAIAAEKLFPKKQAQTPGYTPPPPSPKAPSSSAGFASEFELDPLVVTAPRLKIPATLSIDVRVNATLLRLLETKANERPKEEESTDPALRDLNALSSPVGFLLKIRYTELGFLLTEGLAGTADLVIRNKIIEVARNALNPQARAAALLAVAYSQDPVDRGLFQEALLSQNITVRFGAIEALQIWGKSEATTDIANVARGDFSTPLQIYAAHMLLRARDSSGRDILIRRFQDTDWMVRAMANRYLGIYGTADDYPRILFDLLHEQNNFVKAEMCGALLRLNKLRGKDKK